MLDASRSLDHDLRRSAYAVAAEIMRSDCPLQADERNILSTLAATLELEEAGTTPVLEVMEVLHAPVILEADAHWQLPQQRLVLLLCWQPRRESAEATDHSYQPSCAQPGCHLPRGRGPYSLSRCQHRLGSAEADQLD